MTTQASPYFALMAAFGTCAVQLFEVGERFFCLFPSPLRGLPRESRAQIANTLKPAKDPFSRFKKL